MSQKRRRTTRLALAKLSSARALRRSQYPTERLAARRRAAVPDGRLVVATAIGRSVVVGRDVLKGFLEARHRRGAAEDDLANVFEYFDVVEDVLGGGV